MVSIADMRFRGANAPVAMGRKKVKRRKKILVATVSAMHRMFNAHKTFLACDQYRVSLSSGSENLPVLAVMSAM